MLKVRILMNKKGFTLIEMVVVIVLVGILAAVAIPMYSNYALKGRASEANNIIGALMSGADAWQQEKGTYVGFGASTAFTNAIARRKYFGYATSGEAANAIVITATGNSTDANLTATDTLRATISATAATTWLAAGDCSAPS